MLNFILLQAQANTAWGNYAMIGVMGVVFYFFFIRPQQKKQKEQKKYSEDIRKGQNVVTIGGIHGKILSIEDSTMTLDIDRGTKLTIEKSSINMELSKKANHE